MLRIKLKWGADIFEGDVPQGVRSGKFTCLTLPGQVYEGEFLGDKITGVGKMTYSNGSSSAGEWVNGDRAGLCEYRYGSGDVIRGIYVNDKRNGPAEYVFASGDIERSAYIDGKKQGPGVYISPSGQVYSGDFLNEGSFGFGETRYASGDRYIGEYLNEKRHGKGRYIFKNGDIRDRFWENGSETSVSCEMKDVLPKAEQGCLTFNFSSRQRIIAFYCIFSVAARAKANADEAMKGGWFSFDARVRKRLL